MASEMVWGNIKMVDYIIIGGGHNSLVCAAHLLMKGQKVLICERNPVLGGAVQTAELTEKNFHHDVGAMNLSLFAGSGFHQKYAALLAEYGLEFVPVVHCFASVFKDDSWLGVGTDLEKTCALFAKESQRDAEKWRQNLTEFPANAEYIFALLGNPASAWQICRLGFKLWRKTGSRKALALLQLLTLSARVYLQRNYQSTKIHALLAAWGMHLDLPPDQNGSALFPYLEGMANQAFGMVLGKGGADNMIKALQALILAKGGQIKCDADVREVLMVDGKAKAVMLQDGSKLEARKGVIANIAPQQFAQLLPQGSGQQDFDDKMQQFHHAPGTFMLHLALDELPDWRADKKLQDYAYVHIAPDLDYMARSYQQAQAGLLPEKPVLVVGQPTAIDSSRAPKGKHILWVQARMVPAQIKGDAAGKITATDWETVKEKYATRVIELLAEYAPNIQKNIIAQAVYSPLDLESWNCNLVGGDQICGSHHLWQFYMFRPAAGFANWQTPVKNLYMIGAATWPGAGVGGGSGYMLAKELVGE